MTPNQSIGTVLLWLFCLPLLAQETPTTYPKRTYTTTAITGEAPTIDGNLDDPAWNLVEWTTDYVEFEPDVGTPPTEQTKMKILGVLMQTDALEKPSKLFEKQKLLGDTMTSTSEKWLFHGRKNKNVWVVR